MTISLADAAKLRSSHHTPSLVLNAVPLTVIATARISQGSFIYPLTTFAVDTASVDWTTKVKRGMAFSIGTEPLGTDITWGTVKSTPGGATDFSFDAKTLGDSGYATDIRLPIAQDQWVTVYKHRPMWGILSAIRNKIFYKDYDQTYVSQGSQPAPVQNLGKHRQAFVDPITGTVQLTFTSTVIPWGAATVSSRAWTCEGATAIGGTTGASVTYEFTPGWYVIECLATDSNSKTQLSYRYVFINDTEGVYPTVENWVSATAPTDRNGLKMSLALAGDFTESDIYPGQFWQINKSTTYNGAPLDDEDQLVDTFAGYLSDRSITRTITTPSIDLTAESPIVYAKRIGAVSQQIVEKTSPTKWTECTSALSNPPGAMWYILQHHAPNVLAGHDFIFDTALKTLRKQSFVFQAGSIGGQLDFVQDLIPGNIGCRADGSIVMSAIAQYMTTNDRNAIDNKFEWTEQDILAPLTYAYNFHPSTRVVKGNAFAYAGGVTALPYMSRAESSQGTSGDEFTVIVPVATAQQRLNEITGHWLAMRNAPTPQTPLDANRCMDIAEPVDCNVWHTLVIPATYDPMGIGWVNKRVTSMRAGRQWRQTERGLIEQISHEWQPETFGQLGKTVPVPRGDAAAVIDDGFNTQLPTPFDPKFPTAFALAWNEAGDLARTSSFNSSSPAWKPINSGITGAVQDVTFDYSSDYLTIGSGELGAWVVSRLSDDINTYYSSDVRLATTVIWSLQETITATGMGRARIANSKTDALLLQSEKYPLGLTHFRSTDGGTTFNSEGINSDQIAPNDLTANDDVEIGMAVDGVKKLITHPNTVGQYFLYAASTATGAFSIAGSSPSGDSPFPMITVDGQNNAYATTPPNLTVFDENVTFDDGTWADYDIDGENGTPSLAIGQTGLAAYIEAVLLDNLTETSLKVTLNFDEIRNVLTGSEISFDWKIIWTGTPVIATNILSVETIADGHFESVTFDLFSNGAINDVWQERTVNLNIADQTEIAVQLRMTDGSDLTAMEFFIDNVHVTLADTPATPDKLYRVEDYDGSPAWVDITPLGIYTPRYPYALAIDPFAPDRILMVAESDSVQHLYGSDDNGDTWQDGGVTTDDYRGCKVAGDILVLFGVGVIRMSNDNGATFASRVGNWASAVGTIGTIKGCLVAISEV